MTYMSEKTRVQKHYVLSCLLAPLGKSSHFTTKWNWVLFPIIMITTIIALCMRNQLQFFFTGNTIRLTHKNRPFFPTIVPYEEWRKELGSFMQPFLRLRDYAFHFYVAHSDKLLGWETTIMEMKKDMGN